MKDENIDSFMKSFKELCEKYDIKKEHVVQIVKKEEMQERANEIREEVEAHRYLVGKTFRKKIKPDHGMFPEMYRYYKVVSERSPFSNCVSCLIFDEKPHYWYELASHRVHDSGDSYLGEFLFTPIWIDEIRVKNAMREEGIESYEEIDPNLFDSKMDNLIAEIKEMKWEANHWRGGGKLPSDEGWKNE